MTYSRFWKTKIVIRANKAIDKKLTFDSNLGVQTGFLVGHIAAED